MLSACQNTATPVPVVNTITMGQTIQGTLSTGETHLIFVGAANEPITIEFTTTGAPPPVILVDPENTSIARINANINRVEKFRLPLQGQYTLIIGAGVGDYALTVRNDTSLNATLPPVTESAANKLNIGDSRYTTLKSIETVDIWSFAGKAGDVVSARLTTSVPGLSLRLYAPDGTPLGGDDNPDNTVSVLVSGATLPADGLYHIQVTGRTQAGDYTLSLVSGILPTLTPEPVAVMTSSAPIASTQQVTTQIAQPSSENANQIKIGQTVDGIIANQQDTNHFAIFGPAGTVISIGMFHTSDSKLIPAFEVFAPNGKQVAQASGASGAVVNSFTMPVTGAYILYAHADQNKSSGAYTISIGEGITLRDIPSGNLTADILAQGKLERTGDRQIWSFDLPANAEFFIETTPLQAGFQPIVEVITPDGKVLGSATMDKQRQITKTDQLLTPIQGTYHIRVAASAGIPAGAYSILPRLIKVSPTATFSLATDQTIDAKVAHDERYTYSFKAVPGVVLTVSVTGKASFDPVIELYDPSGQRIASSDDTASDNPNAFIQTSLNSGIGTYTIQVHGYAMTPGTFTLHVKVE